MLAELSIENLVLIAEARLEFCPGLNVITGETGAGKTLLAQAIGLLAGQKGGEELIRPGAPRALVQALFEGTQGSFAVARELPRGGRSRAHLNGLLSSAAAVEEALHQRLAFYGQLEHARLLHFERQLELLDGADPGTLAPLHRTYRDVYERACALTRAHGEMCATHKEREREIDMLRFQVHEIDQVHLETGEEKRLALERERLRHAGTLLERVGGALAQIVDEGGGEGAALDGVRAAERQLGEAVGLDEGLAPLMARLGSLSAELDDLAAQLRDYRDDLDIDPARRDAIELRHDRVRTLLRKYGDSADEVLAFAETARQRLEEITTTAVDEERSATVLKAAQEEAAAAALALSAERRRVAPRVAEQVQRELRSLAMPHATLEVVVSARGEGWPALGPGGIDEIEFLFGANPGVPIRPLRETASGGELSRAMLAIRGIVTLSDDVETLIFDEVDQGIGGVTASALGERLARLAERLQVVCITHLPQVAAFAERHFAIVKESDPRAGTTETSVRPVHGDERLAELCRMLGAAPDDPAARAHAAGLLAKAGGST